MALIDTDNIDAIQQGELENGYTWQVGFGMGAAAPNACSQGGMLGLSDSLTPHNI